MGHDKLVEVQPEVDAGGGKGLHAGRVVTVRVHVVHANAVGANRLHQLGIEGALLAVGERIVGRQLVRNAYSTSVSMQGILRIGHPTFHEVLTTIGVEELGAFNAKRRGIGKCLSKQNACDGQEASHRGGHKFNRGGMVRAALVGYRLRVQRYAIERGISE